MSAERPSHPLLVPPDLVHPVVVAPGIRDTGLVELGMKEQPAECVLTASRSSVDTYAGDVVPRIFRGHRLVPEDSIGEAGIAKIFPCDVVERLRAVRCSHPVDLHDDEPELGLRLHLVVGEERLGDERALRTRIDVLVWHEQWIAAEVCGGGNRASEGHRLTVFEGHNPVCSPSADQLVHHTGAVPEEALPSTEWQVPGAAQMEHLRDVEIAK